ncbi:ATP-binding protein [Paenibacillus polymyxa]|uniref:ATP-binding protein n=1 Tax=Paenibacillus polymyxa TaxID=1406 RepID=UPI0003D3A441|nr:ATP-binding protein [Paenibacillus polymyxa]AIW41067.1 hypothetical protein X809_34340 [Paenibacillus polymyxa CR1]
MSKIILKKLRINKKTSIEFNAKLNYVVGNNGSGKTTLFHLIQYILGLRINSNRLTYLNSNYDPYLICEFNNKIVKITRKLDSNIIVFEGDIVIEVRANSIELNELYSELLGIKSLPHYNDRSALEILGFSFYSDFEFKKNNTERHEIYNKILGYNPDYLNAIKNDIKNFESQISLENQSIKLVEQYKKEVERSLEGLIKVESIEPINKLLNSEFSKIREQLLKNYELYYMHRVYIKRKIMSEDLLRKLSV